MQSTLIFRGVPEKEQSDVRDDVSGHLLLLLLSKLNLNYNELDLQLSRGS